MNIFRILASGKHKFREEYVSAVLAYLLSPKMDHGLGTAFLDTLLRQIAQKSDQVALKQLASQFQNKFREDLFNNQSTYPLVEMEFPYPIPGKSKGFIDVVIRCEDWFILLENKIHVESTTKEQMKEQYEGFRMVLDDQGMSDSRVLSIYLVPAIGGPDGWSVSQTSLDEIDFIVRSGDLISLVTWQSTDDEDNISIVGCIRELLNKESAGEISPISFEVKHLLLSLIDFTIGGFQGFPYDRTTPGGRPSDQMQVSEVLKLEGDLYIGVQYGIAGTILKAWKDSSFLHQLVKVTEDANRGWQYLPLNDFKIVAQWAMEPDKHPLDGINWKGKPFGTQNLYRVAKSAGKGIYIGIKGGLDRLRSMTPGMIKDRPGWEISADKRSPQWFSGEEFCQVLESKGITYD